MGDFGALADRQPDLVLQGEPRAAEAGVDLARHPQARRRRGPAALVIREAVGESLLLFQDQSAVAHASGREQVDEGGLGAAAV